MLTQKFTLNDFRAKKGVEKISAITAYDALMAGIFDGEVDMILVGDSLAMSFGGQSDTLQISLDSMIYHTQAVCKATKKSFILADMPFGSYANAKQAIKNATRFYKHTKADALKLEVDETKKDIIKALSSEGIAVMAHIGLKPQFMRFDGGFKVKGKNEDEAKCLLETAFIMQECGAFTLLLEGIKSEVAEQITNSVKIPTIGIGAGGQCDGQILVWSDAFGFFDEFKPKFVRTYANGKQMLKDAIKRYNNDVKTCNFPAKSESY